jgi:chromosome segregation ATPase
LSDWTRSASDVISILRTRRAGKVYSRLRRADGSLNVILTKIAARFGFVPLHRYDALRRANDEARTATLAWKEKAGDLLKKLERSDTQLKRHIRALRHARADVDKLQQRVAEFDRLREQLGQTDEALMIAREQLTAIEVKLDILEGAANILDARTRTVPQQQPVPTTGAAV